MGEACGSPTEAPTEVAEASEAAEDVDGMPERGGVSSHSPTEDIRLRRVPAAGKRGKMAMVKRSWVGVS